MKLLSIIFFISAFISVILSVLAFMGKISHKGKDTGIVLVVAGAVFGLCELACIWNSTKGLILIIAGMLLVNVVFTISKDEGENEN